MNNKERFISLLKSTKREGIEKLILWLENTSFFDDPASARFHGNFKGGLCEHSLIVYDEFVKLTNRDDDTSKIACLLHDICKIGTYKIIYKNVKNEDTGEWVKIEQYENIESDFPFGHGEKSVVMLLEYIDLTKEEMMMIRWHMGAYESKECWRELGKAQKMYPSVLYIHFADMIASTVRGV